MSVRVEEYEKVCVIEVMGDFTGDNAHQAAAALEQQTDPTRRAGMGEFVLDMTKCSLIDSEGLEILLRMKRRCEDQFGQIKLAGVDENFRTILRMTRLEPKFETHADLPAALKNLQ
jgi:anti-anti-sigma factor